MFISLHQIIRNSLEPYPGERVEIKEILVNLDNVKCFEQSYEITEEIRKKGNEIYGNLIAKECINKYASLICFMNETETQDFNVIESLDYIELKIRRCNKN